MDKDLYTELEQAYEEGRQPLCPHCRQPLVIEETQYKTRVWRWDAKARRYHIGILDAGTERPGCLKCSAEFSIFIGDSKLLRELGIDY